MAKIATVSLANIPAPMRQTKRLMKFTADPYAKLYHLPSRKKCAIFPEVRKSRNKSFCPNTF